MAMWIYNDGSAAHRGVWHLAKFDTIKKETVPEDRRRYTSEVKDYTRPIHNPDAKSYYERTTYPVIGTYEVETVSPEHVVYTADAACGQRRRIRQGSLGFGPHITGHKKYIGKKLRVTRKVNEPLVKIAVLPPEPSCSRCVRKAFPSGRPDSGVEVFDGSEDGVSNQEASRTD